MAGVVHRYHRLGRRKYRERMYAERAKPLAQYTTEELYARFRFGRDDIKYIAYLVRPKVQHKTKRSHALSVEEQCLIALRFYASGTFYQVVGDNMGVDKSTVSNVVKAVSVELASLVNEFVSFPKDDQMAQTKRSFFLLGNMPNTIGVIDCTRVHIQAPHEREWQYVNRKGRHSINVQLVANADLIITNCVVKWPGSVHDARILRESALYRKLQSNRPNGIILGDSAYPLLPWLMTPFPAANTPEQAGFNSAHCKTKCTIELLNGVLKRRFACLNYLRVEPKVACNIILACIVLHNIATRRNVPLDDIYDGPEPDEVQPEQPPMFTPNEGQTGSVIRDAIVRHYF
ncbi:putative nuclease HARBI1 [Polypterus senegalus]|uniref:putative nuclease HARBI1 n=1 Tax=Polypterus senegalus TaxID=55291 RepID=UPI00196402BF|nr:putative nuclease HARBI1 [Polypterus senegalus]